MPSRVLLNDVIVSINHLSRNSPLEELVLENLKGWIKLTWADFHWNSMRSKTGKVPWHRKSWISLIQAFCNSRWKKIRFAFTPACWWFASKREHSNATSLVRNHNFKVIWRLWKMTSFEVHCIWALWFSPNIDEYFDIDKKLLFRNIKFSTQDYEISQSSIFVPKLKCLLAFCMKGMNLLR